MPYMSRVARSSHRGALVGEQMTQGGACAASADLLLVGSMPFATVEEMFETCGPALGRHVAAMPDGEVGDRWDWIGYLRRHVFSKHPDLVVTGMTQDHDFSDPDRGVQYVEGQDSWETFQLRSGVDSLVFDDLHAGSVAVESYGVFRRLRDEGVIPEGVRFQVCFPGSSSAIEPYFSNPDDWPAAKRAYEAAVCVEVERMLEAIPADDLAVQFDLCYEVMDLAMGAEVRTTSSRRNSRLKRSSFGIRPSSESYGGRRRIRCSSVTTGATARGAGGR